MASIAVPGRPRPSPLTARKAAPSPHPSRPTAPVVFRVSAKRRAVVDAGAALLVHKLRSPSFGELVLACAALGANAASHGRKREEVPVLPYPSVVPRAWDVRSTAESFTLRRARQTPVFAGGLGEPADMCGWGATGREALGRATRPGVVA